MTEHEHDRTEDKKESGGFFSGIGNKLNEMAGGGAAGEAKEDKLDKSIDWVQEHVLHQGQQSDESATEQLKDEQISDFIRREYKSATGHEFPVSDKS